MSKSVRINEFADAISDLLEEYGDAATDVIREVAPELAKSARKELKATSPVGNENRHYADGWSVQTENIRNGVAVTIYNRLKPGLTHLLEHGHALRNGGRSKAIPHIAPVNEKIQRDFVEVVSDRLEAIQ